MNDTKRKQKVLGPNQKLKFNPTELIIYCKDFRIVRFRFDEAGPESAKKVICHFMKPCCVDRTSMSVLHVMFCLNRSAQRENLKISLIILQESIWI